LTSNQPDPASVRAALFPNEYGAAGGADDLLPWSWVEERLTAAPNYWLSTVTPSGLPHVRPVDGVWVEGALCFGGSPETRWVRNLQANPAASVNLSSYTEAIILEGRAELVTDPAHPLAEPSQKASIEKYPQYYGEGAAGVEFQPFWLFRPARAYAWLLDRFPASATRWDFPRN
jgi:hypothetical protein